MKSGLTADLDFIEELRLRRWARENYAPRGERLNSWHPIIHDEMARKDDEVSEGEAVPTYALSKN